MEILYYHFWIANLRKLFAGRIPCVKPRLSAVARLITTFLFCLFSGLFFGVCPDDEAKALVIPRVPRIFLERPYWPKYP